MSDFLKVAIPIVLSIGIGVCLFGLNRGKNVPIPEKIFNTTMAVMLLLMGLIGGYYLKTLLG